jgi:DNA replication and repair protein RecF
VRLRSLRIANLRLIEHGEVEFAPDWNVFVGGNGAGKTTLLEAAFLLSHGRSFRPTTRDALSREGSEGFSIFGELERAGSDERVGLSRNQRKLEARLNGVPIPIGDLMRHTAVVCFEPGSHELIVGGAEERRRYLDWGVFHVERDFLSVWRRYQRALRQRNALLRQAADGSELEPWDLELAVAAAPLTEQRHAYFDALRPHVKDYLAEFLPELGIAELRFDPGFDSGLNLAEILSVTQDRDRARGYTGAGPHRADWSVSFATARRREFLSRGQEKLCALALVIGQARLFERRFGEWPVVCLDDLASEVDATHLRRVLDAIDTLGAQVLLTGTDAPRDLADVRRPVTRFHVERGHVARLL